VQAIATIGLLGIVAALLTIAGSCVVVWLIGTATSHFDAIKKYQLPLDIDESIRKPRGERQSDMSEVVKDQNTHSTIVRRFKAPLRLLSIVVGGFLIGLIIPPLQFNPGIITEWTLNILLFFIGMQFRQSNVKLGEIIKSPATILLPLCTAIGSLLGGLLLVPLFSLSAEKALALSSGFGWYSLSGVLISNLGDPVLGSSAFLANMLRESIGLVLIPVLSQTKTPAMAISVAGATSMDVSLPLIEQTLGPEAVPISFLSGALLSALVPILVPLFMRA